MARDVGRRERGHERGRGQAWARAVDETGCGRGRLIGIKVICEVERRLPWGWAWAWTLIVRPAMGVSDWVGLTSSLRPTKPLLL